MRPTSSEGLAIVAALREAIVETGWSKTARLCGLDRTVLHRAFPKDITKSGRNFETVCVVARALGYSLGMEARQ